MPRFFITLPCEDDRYVDAVRYAVEDDDLLFFDKGGEEVGRVVDFQELSGASVLQYVADDEEDETGQDDD